MTREYHEGYQQGYKDAKEEDKELTAKNDLGVREFEGIEVTYPPEEVCIYPEYKGKPYFAIKYKENGKEMVGYGTYNPEVLSQYLKDYFISTTKNDLGVDAISRIGTIDYLCKHCPDDGECFKDCDEIKHLRELPSVTPQYSSELEKNSKKLEKDFGELDCISREQALRELKESAEHHANDSREETLLKRDRDIIKALPSVTPQLSVSEVTALAEWTEKLTKASEDAYNKGYADGVKSVNICPHCGEYMGEEE